MPATLAVVGRLASGSSYHRDEGLTLPRGALHAGLGGCLLLAAVLGFAWLDREGFANPYYAAAVRSMLADPRNFLFAAYDPGGFVSVDKPPVGLWLQAASAALFGFSGASLILPQVLAQIVSVALVYAVVARTHGAVAGLIAAVVLTLMPISVATARNNTMDSLLVPVQVTAAWAVLKGVERGQLRWWLATMALLGLAFNIKMLQAYLVLPAIAAVYLLGAPLSWRSRAQHTAAGIAVLLAVSLAWAVLVDLTPASARPYVGGSAGNSVLELIVGYNGITRVGGLDSATVSFGRQLAGQVAWLLPLAAIGTGLAVARHRIALPLDRKQQAIVLWGTWSLVQVGVFAVARFWHPYYLVVSAPAIAALVGLGVVTLWQHYARPSGVWWLLPVALAVTAAFQLYLLAPFGDWMLRLGPPIALAMLGTPLVLIAGHARRRWLAAISATALGLGGLFIAPAVWAAIPVLTAPGDPLPLAGPRTSVRQSTYFPGHGTAAYPGLIAYLLAHRGDARFLFATESSAIASPYIIETGLPVMAVGGFDGADRILSPEQMASLVKRGEVHYFVMADRGSDATRQPTDELTAWVRSTCREVPATEWEGPPHRAQAGGDTPELVVFDCAGNLAATELPAAKLRWTSGLPLRTAQGVCGAHGQRCWIVTTPIFLTSLYSGSTLGGPRPVL